MFQPIHEAVFVNGETGRGQRLQDYNIRNIIMVKPTSYVDPTAGTTKSGWEFHCYNGKTLKTDVLIFEAATFDGGATLDAVKTFLTTLDAGHTLAKYNGFKRIHLHRDITPPVDILLDNNKIVNRQYDALNNQTNLYVNFGNTVKHTVLTVEGDQTIGGTYYVA